MTRRADPTEATDVEPLCSGTLIWRRQPATPVCERCGASKDELCGDFEAQEAQWDSGAETHG